MAPRPKPTTDSEGSADPEGALDLEHSAAPEVDLSAAIDAVGGVGPDVPSAADVAEPAEVVLVRSRWIGVDPVMVHDPAPRVVLYGHELEVTLEQLEDERTPAVAWADDWTPDPVLDAQCRLAAGITIDEVD